MKTVSCPEPHPFTTADLPAAHDFALTSPAGEDAANPAAHRVVAYDCGVKRGILEGLVRAGCELTVVPWDTPASEVLAMNPDGVFPVSYTHLIVTLDGWAGTQRYGGIWTGDQTGGNWEYIRFHLPTYIGQSLSGNPNVGSDMDRCV